MKRLGLMVGIGALAWLLLLPAWSSAAEWGGGLKFGLNVAFIHGSGVAEFPSFDSSWVLRFGLCGGGFVTVGLSRTTVLQAEALITTKGSHELELGWDEPAGR